MFLKIAQMWHNIAASAVKKKVHSWKGINLVKLVSGLTYNALRKEGVVTKPVSRAKKNAQLQICVQSLNNQ